MLAGSNADWINTIATPELRTQLADAAATGGLSYSATVGLLDWVAAQGPLDASVFADLRTIVANLDVGLTTSPYVTSVLTQLVDGSPANATWTGGGPAAGQLGDLQVGSTPEQMQELIGKWLLGSDLPNPDLPASDGQPALLPTYATQSQPLFGPSGQPTVNDINQGALSDCVVCAGLLEAAVNHPTLLNSMIVDNGNGTYGVRFFVNGDAVWVTVNTDLPVTDNGQLAFNNAFTGNTPLWGDLLEKAYAQLSASGGIGPAAINAFANINDSNDAVVLAALGDRGAAYYSSASPAWASDKQVFINALASGDDLIFNSAGQTYDASGKQQLVPDHGYAVVGYDATTGDFILRNPWGAPLPSFQPNFDTQFEVSMATMAAVSGGMGIGDSASGSVLFTAAASAPPGTFALSLALPAGSALPADHIFSALDTRGQPITRYMLQLVGDGSASLQLNGATDLATAAQTAQGEVVVDAGDLGKVTVAAGTATGSATLEVWAYDGQWSPVHSLPLAVTGAPLTVVPKLGIIVAPGATVPLDSLFATLGAGPDSTGDSVMVTPGAGTIAMGVGGAVAPGPVTFAAGDVASATFTAPTTPGQVQLEVSVSADGVWSSQTPVSVIVADTASDTLRNADAGHFSAVGAILDSAANVLAQQDGIATLFAAGELKAVTVADTATAVAASLDGLAAMAQTGALTGITLTDGGPLTVSDAQLVHDAPALALLSDHAAVTAPGVSAAVTTFVIGEDAARIALGLPAANLEVPGIAAAGSGNSVIGWQSANLPAGNNVVVLDHPQASYTLQVDAAGQLHITDVGSGDATAGQSITVSGARTVVFDGAASTASGVYAEAVFIEPGIDATIARLDQASLGHLPDLPGLERLVAAYHAGESLTQIEQDLVGEAPFAGTSDSAFITIMYSNALGHAPDADAAATYMAQLATDAAAGIPEATARAAVFDGFVHSPEVIAASTHWLFG